MTFALVEDDEIRQQIRDKFAFALLVATEENHIEKTHEDISMIAMELEAALYVFNQMRTDVKYKRRARDVSFNLCNPKNPDFRY
jgi:hypothetical protein